MIVVTFTPHISRARYIMQKCFDGYLIMSASPASLSVRYWAWAYIYHPSPFVVGGSGTKQCRLNRGCGAAQKPVSHGSSVPFGFDTTTFGAQPCAPRSKPNGYRR